MIKLKLKKTHVRIKKTTKKGNNKIKNILVS